MNKKTKRRHKKNNNKGEQKMTLWGQIFTLKSNSFPRASVVYTVNGERTWQFISNGLTRNGACVYIIIR